MGGILLPGNAIPADVLSGKVFSAGANWMKSGSMSNRGAVEITPGTVDQAILAGYHNGSGYVAGDADLVADNIKSGVSIFGVAGNFVDNQTLTASNTVSFYRDNIRSAGTALTKVREVRINRSGNIRVYYNARVYTGESGCQVKSRIYVNGLPVGTEHIDNFSSYTEDFLINSGDYLQLYLQGVTGATNVRNEDFRIMCNFSDPILEPILG